MNVLGIESTAHTLGIGIFNGKKIVHAKDMYKPKNEGIIPRKAADHHLEFSNLLIKNVLQESNLKLKDIDGFAFSQGPGIGQTLQFGCSLARYLAVKYNKPLISVNHCQAHIEIGKWERNLKDPLTVYVSGGNTQLIIEKNKKYHVLGETLDIGMGNLFDTFGRDMGLEFAHGSVLSEMAEKGKYIELPYSVKGMNIVFGGLLTASKKALKEHKKEDIVYSMMHNAFASLTEAAERALCLTHKKELLLCGGVAQNKMFQSMLKKMLEPHKVKFAVPRNEYNADNGAMIALLGYRLLKEKKIISVEKAIPRQKWRVDKE
jgi:N6-L-threonylcarbamoyladenine synthase